MGAMRISPLSGLLSNSNLPPINPDEPDRFFVFHRRLSAFIGGWIVFGAFQHPASKLATSDLGIKWLSSMLAGMAAAVIFSAARGSTAERKP